MTRTIEEWLEDRKNWVCTGCDKRADADCSPGEWRWSGTAWEHSHPYPVGHVLCERRPLDAEKPVVVNKPPAVMRSGTTQYFRVVRAPEAAPFTTEEVRQGLMDQRYDTEIGVTEIPSPVDFPSPDSIVLCKGCGKEITEDVCQCGEPWDSHMTGMANHTFASCPCPCGYEDRRPV